MSKPSIHTVSTVAMLIAAVLAGPLALVLAYEIADHFELNLFHLGDSR